jgi:hypothetical protein
LNADKNNRRRKAKFVFLSKTKEMGDVLDSLIADEAAIGSTPVNDLDSSTSVNIHVVRSGLRLQGFARLDEAFLKPLFIRKFTDEVWA